MKFKVPSIVELEVPSPYKDAVVFKRYVSKVALYTNIFSSGLRMPFCHPVRNLLDFLSLAPAQFHLNTWKILVSYCVIWQWALGEVGSKHLNDLTACQFFLTQTILEKSENTCNFCSFQALARLEM